MSRRLTLEERKSVLKKYWKTENPQDVICDWCLHFSTDPPTRLTIYRIRDKFEETSSVTDAPRSGRPTMCRKENVDTVSEAYARSPQKLLRRGSAEMGIKRTYLRKILTELNMKTYIPRLIHGLLEDDPDRRSQFCEHFVSLCEDNTTLEPNCVD